MKKNKKYYIDLLSNFYNKELKKNKDSLFPEEWTNISIGKKCPEELKDNENFKNFLKYFSSFLDWEEIFIHRNLEEDILLKYKEEYKPFFPTFDWNKIKKMNPNLTFSEKFISNFIDEFVSDKSISTKTWLPYVLETQKLSDNFIKKTFFQDEKLFTELLKYSKYLMKNKNVSKKMKNNIKKVVDMLLTAHSNQDVNNIQKIFEKLNEKKVTNSSVDF